MSDYHIIKKGNLNPAPHTPKVTCKVCSAVFTAAWKRVEDDGDNDGYCFVKCPTDRCGNKCYFRP